MEQEQIKRATAIKLLISEVGGLPYVKEDSGWASSFLQAGERIYRLSLAGTVIQKSTDNLSLTIDDGSGTIALRVFEDRGMLSKDIGEVVFVIGKPREFNSERYVLPEIVKRVDAGWLRVHLKEISKRPSLLSSASLTNQENKKETGGEEGSNDFPDVEEAEDDSSGKICAFIRQHDPGDGVDIQEIIVARIVESGEELVNSLLRKGDIFEVHPGRVKVLE